MDGCNSAELRQGATQAGFILLKKEEKNADLMNIYGENFRGTG
jgi:hypothetical protein